MKLTSLRTFLAHADFGLKSTPIFTQDIYSDSSPAALLGYFVFNLSYFLLIGKKFLNILILILVVLMVAIISGVIIDEFARRRSRREALREQLNSSCFICGIPREEFDKRQKKGYINHR